MNANAVSLLHEDPENTHSRIAGVLLADGREVHAGEVVLANGLGAAHVAGCRTACAFRCGPCTGTSCGCACPKTCDR